MGAVGGPPSPAEHPWSAQRIEAALPGPLRAQFQRELLAFLALWQAKAHAAAPQLPGVQVEPPPGAAQHKWGDLMDDWEL